MRISKGTKKVEASLNTSISAEEIQFWNPFTQRLEVEGNTVNKVLEDIIYEFAGLPYRFKEFTDFSPNDVKAKVLKLEANLVTESMDALYMLKIIFEQLCYLAKITVRVLKGTTVNPSIILRITLISKSNRRYHWQVSPLYSLLDFTITYRWILRKPLKWQCLMFLPPVWL